jgi:hypothetical protein
MAEPVKTFQTQPYPIGTSQSDANAFTLAAVQAMASAYGALYVRQPSIQGGPVTVDLDSLIRDSVSLGINLLRETKVRWSAIEPVMDVKV